MRLAPSVWGREPLGAGSRAELSELRPSLVHPTGEETNVLPNILVFAGFALSPTGGMP